MDKVLRETQYKHPVGIRCTRTPTTCFSWQYDKRCYGKSCPFNGYHVSLKEKNGKKEVEDGQTRTSEIG